MMSFQDIVDLIGKNYANLTKSQQKVAGYLAENLCAVVEQSARSLAQKIGVSDASVIRFASALGFDGYGSFHAAVRNALLSERSIERVSSATENINADDLRRRMIEEQCSLIRRSFELVPEERLNQAVKSILEARKILILGGRSLYGPAFLLAHKLNQYLNNTALISYGGGYEYDQLISLGKQDLLISMSYERYSRRIYEFTSFARKKTQCRILTITDNAIAPINTCTDIPIVLIGDSKAAMDSKVSLVSFIEILVASVVKEVPQRARENLHRMEANIAPIIWFSQPKKDS